MLRPLYEFNPEELLSQLFERQAAVIEAEADEARAKAKFEAIQGAVMDSLRASGKPVEIAKKCMWDSPTAVNALDEYWKWRTRFDTAKAAEYRAKRAIDLYQTARADVRKV